MEIYVSRITSHASRITHLVSCTIYLASCIPLPLKTPIYHLARILITNPNEP